MKKRKYYREELDTTDEVVTVIQDLHDSVQLELDDLQRRVEKLESPDKKKPSIVKKVLGLIFVMLLTSPALAVWDITYDNVSNPESLTLLLQDRLGVTGQTYSFSNGLTIDNATNNVFEWNENSEEIKWTFGSNSLTLSSGTGVVSLAMGTIVPSANQMLFNPVSAAVGTTEGTVYYDSDTDKLFVRDSSQWVDLTAGASGVTDLDTAYNGGNTIDVDGSAVTLTVSDGDNNPVAIFAQNDSTNDPTAVQITSAADAANAIALDIDAQTTGRDIEGTGASWYVTGAGVLTAVSETLSSGLTVSSGNTAIGDGTGTFSVASSGIDISSAGAITNATDITTTGDVFLANGKGVKSSTTSGQTVGVYGYDNDTGPSYVGALVITNGNTPATVLGNSGGTTAITSSDWAISATGAMTGIGALTMDGALTVSNATVTLYTNEAVTIGHAANGAADDLTISQTGNQDASLIVTSAGSGTDALTLSTTANAGDIVISSNDKIDVDSTGTSAWNVAGDTFLLQVDADGAADDFTIAVVGAQNSSLILSSEGTAADALQITATAGGIDITANGAAADEDIDIATSASVNITSTEDIADSIKILSNGGTNDTITITNTPGNTAAAITLTASAGGITLNGASGGVVFTAGQTRKVLYDVNDVKTDVTNPPARGEIGTAGQFMADALKFDADGGATGDDICFISWIVPEGYKTDTAKLNVYWTHSTAEDLADEAVMDFTVNAAAVGEALDAAGTAGDAVTTVIADASASAGKLQKTQINIEIEDIVVGDLVTIMYWIDEDASAFAASGTLDVHYFEIEYESTE